MYGRAQLFGTLSFYSFYKNLLYCVLFLLIVHFIVTHSYKKVNTKNKIKNLKNPSKMKETHDRSSLLKVYLLDGRYKTIQFSNDQKLCAKDVKAKMIKKLAIEQPLISSNRHKLYEYMDQCMFIS